MSHVLAQDIAFAIIQEARSRLKALGVDRFNESRLAQLYHALNHRSSVWFNKSDAEKQSIRSDIVSIIGKTPYVETVSSLKEKADKKAAKTKKSKPSTHKVPDLSFILDERLRALLLARAPRRPWCCDEFYANLPRPLEVALQKKYLQLNPPGFSSFLITDIDRPGAANAWVTAGLPMPTWITINQKNGHAHLVWALTCPVWRGAENQKPARLFDVVQGAYRERLDGDEGFAHLLTKNPASDAWMLTSESNFATYDLSFLSEHVKLSSMPKKKRAPESLGRNCLIFDELRYWTYLAVHRYAGGDPISFYSAVVAHAELLNSALVSPMYPSEVLGISKSVERWVWKNMHSNEGSGRFSEKQAERGKESGRVRRQRAMRRAVDSFRSDPAKRVGGT